MCSVCKLKVEQEGRAVSITDELRKYANMREYANLYAGARLCKIADRIDAEHERAMREEYQRGANDEEIVRCRDCKYRAKACCWCINGGVEPDGFCAWGERREA